MRRTTNVAIASIRGEPKRLHIMARAILATEFTCHLEYDTPVEFSSQSASYLWGPTGEICLSSFETSGEGA